MNLTFTSSLILTLNEIRVLLIVVASVTLGLTPTVYGFSFQESDDEKPNIVFILADDLGKEGISAYRGEVIETPNIDRLAEEGMTFTNMYVNPYCTPTRSELLTGRYPFRTGTLYPIWDYQRHKNDVLDTSEPTFARQLKKAGYRTAIAGKWQLSFLSKQDWVHEFGFDTYQFWQLMDAQDERTTRFHNPYFRRDGEVIHNEIKDRYGPDVNVEFLIDFITKSHNDERPFMAYYTSLLPHYPWVPTPESKEQSIPSDNLYGQGIPKFYPDMVRRLDYNVGKLLESLDELGIAENTLVIFLTDNGTDQRLFGRINGQTLYGGKSSLTDRGSQVPLLMRWPKRIRPGSYNTHMVEAADFLPTFSEITGAPLPDTKIDGESFAKSLFGEGMSRSKNWVHIQKQQGRYLRTKEWIVTDNGEYKKVQPYPNDAIEVSKESMNESIRYDLEKLEEVLRELKE